MSHISFTFLSLLVINIALDRFEESGSSLDWKLKWNVKILMILQRFGERKSLKITTHQIDILPSINLLKAQLGRIMTCFRAQYRFKALFGSQNKTIPIHWITDWNFPQAKLASSASITLYKSSTQSSQTLKITWPFEIPETKSSR